MEIVFIYGLPAYVNATDVINKLNTMRKNDYTIFLLVAAGLGIYWYYKKQSMPPATTIPVDQTPISTNPVVAAAYDVKYTINGMRKFGSVPNTI